MFYRPITAQYYLPKTVEMVWTCSHSFHKVGLKNSPFTADLVYKQPTVWT